MSEGERGRRGGQGGDGAGHAGLCGPRGGRGLLPPGRWEPWRAEGRGGAGPDLGLSRTTLLDEGWLGGGHNDAQERQGGARAGRLWLC